jgi:ubiquinone/menaquinone biosynthesis C-methylase UbiE
LTSAGDGPLIDLGAGTGNLIERLIAAGRSVTAVDNSPAMLAQLRSKPALAAEIGRRLTIIEDSAESVAHLEDGRFDGVSILLALFDMRQPRRALENAIRILKPGGILVVTDLKRCFRIAPILNACREQLHLLGRFDELAGDLDRVIQANDALAPATRTAIHAEDLVDILQERHFRCVSFADSHFGQCATVQGSKPS